MASPCFFDDLQFRLSWQYTMSELRICKNTPCLLFDNSLKPT
jgi:hypothetical protein